MDGQQNIKKIIFMLNFDSRPGLGPFAPLLLLYLTGNSAWVPAERRPDRDPEQLSPLNAKFKNARSCCYQIERNLICLLSSTFHICTWQQSRVLSTQNHYIC